MNTEISSSTEPAQVARRLFFDDPTQSIDDIAREMDKRRMPLSRDVISRIRLEVRQSISNAKPTFVQPMVRRRDPFHQTHVVVVNPLPKPAPEPFNPPRFVQSQAPAPVAPKPSVVPLLTLKPVEPTKPSEQPEVTTEEKHKWLDDWLLEHAAEATVGKARDALIARFGSALGTTYINEQVKVVRGISTEKKTEPAIQSFGGAGLQLLEVADIAHAMKVLGVRKIEVKGHAYVVDMLD